MKIVTHKGVISNPQLENSWSVTFSILFLPNLSLTISHRDYKPIWHTHNGEWMTEYGSDLLVWSTFDFCLICGSSSYSRFRRFSHSNQKTKLKSLHKETHWEKDKSRGNRETFHGTWSNAFSIRLGKKKRLAFYFTFRANGNFPVCRHITRWYHYYGNPLKLPI